MRFRRGHQRAGTINVSLVTSATTAGKRSASRTLNEARALARFSCDSQAHFS